MPKAGKEQLVSYSNLSKDCIKEYAEKIFNINYIYSTVKDIYEERKVMDKYLFETPMLDFGSNAITQLISKHKWNEEEVFMKIKCIYEYVQNEILFGYNETDYLSASEVLKEGYGQCNTKSTLLMALLRGVGVPCRIHAFAVTKDFQKGVTTPLISIFAPQQILHTWVEIYYNNDWIVLEGVITDKEYLTAIIKRFGSTNKAFNKYAIATRDLHTLSIGWNGKSTYVQREAIISDYGTFNSPDDLFKKYKQKIGRMKSFLYAKYGCKKMTKNVEKIRGWKMRKKK